MYLQFQTRRRQRSQPIPSHRMPIDTYLEHIDPDRRANMVNSHFQKFGPALMTRVKRLKTIIMYHVDARPLPMTPYSFRVQSPILHRIIWWGLGLPIQLQYCVHHTDYWKNNFSSIDYIILSGSSVGLTVLNPMPIFWEKDWTRLLVIICMSKEILPERELVRVTW